MAHIEITIIISTQKQSPTSKPSWFGTADKLHAPNWLTLCKTASYYGQPGNHTHISYLQLYLSWISYTLHVRAKSRWYDKLNGPPTREQPRKKDKNSTHKFCFIQRFYTAVYIHWLSTEVLMHAWGWPCTHTISVHTMSSLLLYTTHTHINVSIHHKLIYETVYTQWAPIPVQQHS